MKLWMRTGRYAPRCLATRVATCGRSGMSGCDRSRQLLRLHKDGRYRSEAHMAEFYEYASYILVFDGVTRDDLNS